MWQDLLAAVALVLIFEGLMPFLSPQGFKRSLTMMLQMQESSLRLMGLICMIIGVIMLYIVR